MNTRIETDNRARVRFGDVKPGTWFAFIRNGSPGVARYRLRGARYAEEAGCVYGGDPVAGVVELELAGTDGQTLLLRRKK